jgi:2-polyprenyl-3-methyl-5-hydroxy-6-metoxy-1,4-benzoquinol methylase
VDFWWLVIPDSAALARIIMAMDYDQSSIAMTYDEARALTPARRRHWQRLLSARVDQTSISLVVDLGCGTGRFSEMLAAELRARVIGLDPSEKMINQARRKPATTLSYLGGRWHTSFRSRRAASISCLCRRSITTCPIRLR